MESSLAFEVQTLRREFWFLKGLIDSFVLAFAISVVVYYVTTGESISFDPALQPFKIISYIFSGLILTITLVLSTELAWATRKAAAGTEDVWYIKGTSTLPVNTFDAMFGY